MGLEKLKSVFSEGVGSILPSEPLVRTPDYNILAGETGGALRTYSPPGITSFPDWRNETDPLKFNSPISFPGLHSEHGKDHLMSFFPSARITDIPPGQINKFWSENLDLKSRESMYNQGVGPGSALSSIGGAPRGAYDSTPSDWQKIGLVDYFNSGEGAVKIAGFTKSMNFSSGELSKHADEGYNRSAETIKKSGREIRTVEIYKEQLKVDSLKATGGWSALYNADHTPKESDLVYDYSNSSTNRDNLDIHAPVLGSTGVTNVRRGWMATEPYNVTPIGTRSWSTREFSAGRAAYDVERIGKFIFSPAGLAFAAKQNLVPLMSKRVSSFYDQGNKRFVLHKGNMYDDGYMQAYFPTSTIAATAAHLTGMPNYLVERSYPFSKALTARGISAIKYGESNPARRRSGDINKVLSRKSPDHTSMGESAYRDPTRKEIDHGGYERSNWHNLSGDIHTLAVPHVENMHKSKTGYDSSNETSGVPFYIKDLRDDRVVTFRAYIDGITENVSPTWDTEEYIGRSEPVYVYGSTERDFSFNLKIWAQTKTELDAIYMKINKLTSMCYPEYKADPHIKVQSKSVKYNKIRMKPPLVELRLGELYKGSTNGQGQLGFIKTLTYTVPDEAPWETDVGRRVPKAFDVAIDFQVIHAKTPGIVPHRTTKPWTIATPFTWSPTHQNVIQTKGVK